MSLLNSSGIHWGGVTNPLSGILGSLVWHHSKTSFSPNKIFAEIYFRYDEVLKRVGVEVYDLNKFSNAQQLTNEILNLVKEGETMVYKALDFSDEDMIEKDMAS